jgi:hypothetical protein
MPSRREIVEELEGTYSLPSAVKSIINLLESAKGRGLVD